MLKNIKYTPPFPKNAVSKFGLVDLPASYTDVDVTPVMVISITGLSRVDYYRPLSYNLHIGE